MITFTSYNYSIKIENILICLILYVFVITVAILAQVSN